MTVSFALLTLSLLSFGHDVVPFSKEDFVYIRPGTFLMGSPPSDSRQGRNETQTKVTITRGFGLLKTEVTQSDWFTVMRDNPSYIPFGGNCQNYLVKEGVQICPNNPVELVSIHRVNRFIKILNERQNIRGCKGRPSDPSGCFRLPTEAEWEYAARAGSATAWFFGDSPADLSAYAWLRGPSGSYRVTYPVGLKKPNAFGLFDIYGNVEELTADRYLRVLPGGTDPYVDQKHTKSTYNVIKGGSIRSSAPNGFRSAYRGGALPIANEAVGFRLARSM